MVCIHFDELRKEVAEALITQIRRENFDFSLAFRNLTNSETKRLIEIAPIEQEHIKIDKYKHISDLFMNELRPNLELSEFSARGIEYILQISERKFIPWRSIAIVIGLASIQIAIGGALMASGFGANIGMGLITEGAVDLLLAARIGYTRDFSWSAYGRQKAASLIISAASMGYSAIQSGSNGIQIVTAGVSNEALEQISTQMVTNSKTIAQQTLNNVVGQNVKRLTMNAIMTKVGENSLLLVNKGISIASPFVLNQLKPKISTTIQIKVNSKFSESTLLKLVRKLYALDLFNEKPQLKKKLDNMMILTAQIGFILVVY